MWLDSGLEDTFKAYWSIADRDLYQAMNDDEARPGTPYPYCVSFLGPDVRAEGDSGRRLAGKQTERRHVTFQFNVYAKSKTVAKSLVSLIADAVEGARLPYEQGCGDRFVRLWREFDAPRREDDKIWAWMISYVVEVDADIQAGG